MAATTLPPIADLNRLSKDEFATVLRLLFESAPILTERLYGDRPYASYDELLDRAATIIDDLDVGQKVEVINAHPRIGERPDEVRRRSSLSYGEQGYDRELALDQDELANVYARLGELNRAYEERFGFRFVVFVNRRPKSAIVDVLEERLDRSREEEIAAALHDVLAIARDRLRSLRTA